MSGTLSNTSKSGELTRLLDVAAVDLLSVARRVPASDQREARCSGRSTAATSNRRVNSPDLLVLDSVPDIAATSPP